MTRLFRFALVLCFGLAIAGCQEELYRGLSQRDANEMLTVLASNGVNATRQPGDGNTFRLLVGRSDLAKAARLVSDAGYPKAPFRSVAELFPGDGLVVTPFEQRARLAYALGQELSQTMLMIDGVTHARVHVVLPDQDIRSGPQRPSASVVLHHLAAADPADLSQRARLIVTNAVPGLVSKDVTVSALAAPNPASSATRPGAAGQSVVPASAGLGIGTVVLFVLGVVFVSAGLVLARRPRVHA